MNPTCRIFRALVLLWVLLAPLGCAAAEPSPQHDAIRLDPQQVDRLGRLVWQNECGGTTHGLTSWNKGEAFPSLGIGHFIWYPAGVEGPFDESFPGVRAALLAREDLPEPPAWLCAAEDCPWPTREAFYADFDGPRLTALRLWLSRTTHAQAELLVRRLVVALPRMEAGLTREEQQRLRANFRTVLASPMGIYPLVDYVNFKGEGIKPTERYRGEGWGLRQVLLGMAPAEPGLGAIDAFATSAERVLRRRVANAPEARREREAGWMPGWANRVETYRAEARRMAPGGTDR